MIGLATPFKVINFGTKLQAYAMQELVSGLGFPVEVIQYQTEFDRRPHVIAKKLFSWKKTRERIERRLTVQKYKSIPGLYPQILARAAAINQFDNLLRKSAPIRGFKTLRDHARQYSAVVCGSDQIWLPVNLHAEFFTLEFAPENVQRVSFAPSFGISRIPPAVRARYIAYLSQLHHTSVREEAGRQIIQDLTGKDVPVVLDPTLTVDSERWVQLAATSTVQRPQGYIFCYFLGTNPEHREAAAALGKEMGLPVVGIPHFEEFVPADTSYADINLFEIGPVDFIHLIQNATLVCTDSFHGTAFSILFRRRFMTFERFKSTSSQSTNSRIHSLLGKLELGDRLASDVASARTIAPREIDYAKTYQRLDALRSSSRQFLKSALANLS